MKFVVFFLLFISVVWCQTVEIDVHITDKCEKPHTRTHIKTNVCFENTIYKCTDNFVEQYTCQFGCKDCKLSRNDTTSSCVKSTLMRCRENAQFLDVGEGGYTYELFAKSDCADTPIAKKYTIGDTCIKGSKLFCTNTQVQEFVYEEDECEGNSPDSRIVLRNGECKKDSGSEYFVKLLQCGNEFTFPLWGYIVLGCIAALFLVVIVVSTPIFIFYNCIRKGGYWNPLREEDKAILSTIE